MPASALRWSLSANRRAAFTASLSTTAAAIPSRLETTRCVESESAASNDAALLMAVTEDYAAVLAELGAHQHAVRLLGAADATHERLAAPRDPTQEAEIAEPIAKAHTALTPEEWQDAYRTGRNTTVEDALIQAHAETPD